MQAHINSFLYQISIAQYEILKIKTHVGAVVLFKIASHGGRIEMKELLTATKHTPIAIRLHIQYLIDAGIVEIHPSPTDRRSKIVEMTENGRRMIREFDSVVEDQLKKITHETISF